ncbi:MAG: 16S rRNA (cytidine(1402)-2'-O)-methyltransferase [Rickettsiales bacterium]|nr:16S rRNA (cytidine(1402)-2'-O)-methyltransferase [Rickettsiales bacterium]
MQDFSKNFPINFESNFESQKLAKAFYIVATPIGNLSDITLRALEVLRSADYIVCEDSRVTAKLLKHYKISDKKLIIYNDHSGILVREKILNFLIQGNLIALVSDAGTPLISDPGHKLVEYLRQYNQKIIPLPGASSLTTALCACGLACDNFLFLGFFPTTKIAKINLLKSLAKNFTAVFFEAPNRVLSTLEIIEQTLENRRVAVIKELTKIHEEIISDNIKNLRQFFINNPQKLRGEFVIVIEKSDQKQKNLSENQLKTEIKKALEAGFSVKELSQNLAEIFDLNKKDIYKIALEIHNSAT